MNPVSDIDDALEDRIRVALRDRAVTYEASASGKAAGSGARAERDWRLIIVGTAVVAAVVGLVAVLMSVSEVDKGRHSVQSEPDATSYVTRGQVLENESHGPELCLGITQESDPPQCHGLPVANWDWNGLPGISRVASTTWGFFEIHGTFNGRALVLTETPAAASPPTTDSVAFDPLCANPIALNPTLNAADWEQLTQTPSFSVPSATAIWTTGAQGPSRNRFVVNVLAPNGSGDAVTGELRAFWQGYACVVERDQPSLQELQDVQEKLPNVVGDKFLTASVDARLGLVDADVLIADAATQARVDDAFGRGLVRLRPVFVPSS
jgi:hypothetical protein